LSFFSYKPIWDIIDKRWDKQLHRPLHAAGYFLNPKLHYGPNFKADKEVTKGMYTCLKRMMGGDMSMVNKIDGQLEFFKGKQGFFGDEVAQLDYRTRHRLNGGNLTVVNNRSCKTLPFVS
jgi:hypothetical protein